MHTVSTLQWGLLGPENINLSRRARSLGLARAVRAFNNLAVPGMGNVFYAKQIFYPLLGLKVAEIARENGKRVSNIEVANAIEAAACWIGFKNNGNNKDVRLRGIRKLPNKQINDFEQVRKRSFYVTNPFRMGTVKALPSLNLVENDATRFNSFRLTDSGEGLIESIAQNFNDSRRSQHLEDVLVNWIKGRGLPVKNSSFTNLLSPLQPLNKPICNEIRDRILYHGDMDSVERRKAIFDWIKIVDSKKTNHSDWNRKPFIITEKHWKDMRAGALFEVVRKNALQVLDELEILLDRNDRSKIDIAMAAKMARKKIKDLKKAASDFINFKYDDSSLDFMATVFCKECFQNDHDVIRRLVERDNSGLRMDVGFIIPGPAFRGVPSQNHVDLEDEEEIDEPELWERLPENISHRVSNMFYLYQDLEGKFTKWL